MFASSFIAFFLLVSSSFAEFPAPGSPAYINDNNLLNYALTLENLEAAFYTQGLAALNVSTFEAAGYNSTVYGYLQNIEAHEQAHVRAITLTLQARGATPNPVCTYLFDFSNVSIFLSTAAALENTGVSAYDGAGITITDQTILSYAASVSTVEARHAAYLNFLNGVNPFPNATDTPLTPAQIIQIAGQFLNCSYNASANLPVNASLVRNATLYPGYNASIYNSSSPIYQNDNYVLQLALTLENIESTFFRAGLNNISESTFAEAGINSTLYEFISDVAAHEESHAAAIRMVLTMRGATPVPLCTYQYPTNSTTNVTAYLEQGAAFEFVGIQAYSGAALYISDPNILAYASTILTVEARHESFLNLLLGRNPFPTAVDPSITPAQTNATAQTYIVTCPAGSVSSQNLTLPVNADVFRNASLVTTGSNLTSGSTTATTTGRTTGSTTSDNDSSSSSIVVASIIFVIATIIFMI